MERANTWIRHTIPYRMCKQSGSPRSLNYLFPDPGRIQSDIVEKHRSGHRNLTGTHAESKICKPTYKVRIGGGVLWPFVGHSSYGFCSHFVGNGLTVHPKGHISISAGSFSSARTGPLPCGRGSDWSYDRGTCFPNRTKPCSQKTSRGIVDPIPQETICLWPEASRSDT